MAKECGLFDAGCKLDNWVESTVGDAVDGNESDLNAWRAACHAWWLAHPRQSTHESPEIEFTSRGLQMLRRKNGEKQ